MKDKFTHVCFIIDESGSMWSSKSDVEGGFRKIIEEQQNNTEGTCAVSMYTFNGSVSRHYLLRDVKDISPDLIYSPGGSTALNDAVGEAIDQIGESLAKMPESERPASNLIVIMTDGEENSSKLYSLSKVRDMIKHQTDKYNWTFMYLGADITTSDIADSLDIKYRGFSTKKNLDTNYSMINTVLASARSVDASTAYLAMDAATEKFATTLNANYAEETGIKLASTNV